MIISGVDYRRRYYRLAYNIVAIITLIPALYLHSTDISTIVVQWPRQLLWLKVIAVAMATICFLWSTKYYDMKSFLGLSKPQQQEASMLVISPLHRFVRHPWYSCALVIIWCRDLSVLQLVSTTMITLYFVVGAKLEEKKLIEEFGDKYRKYMEQVPGLIPQPWKYLKD